MEINGLPLHALVVHAAVVFGPLAALAALLYVVPGLRDRLRWPMLVLVLVATASIWVSFLSGQDFRDSQEFFYTGELGEKLDTHQSLAATLRLFASGFAVVAVASAVLHHRTGLVRGVLAGLLVLSAVGVLVYTVLTGDAGAQAVYGS